MRLGAPIYNYTTAETWISKILKKGYSAAYAPLDIEHQLSDFLPYIDLAEKNNIVISEFGVWNNPLSSDKALREKAVEKCKKTLYYADEIGAKCVVNISGSRGDKWDGPDEKNLTTETFNMIVEVVRDIIDTVNPKRTFYTLETMPWMFPNSIESYLKLIKAIDRKSFAVHFDPVNLITSPEKYYNNGALVKEFINKLGMYIKSVHIKDVLLKPQFLVHLNEVPPGKGNLNYPILFNQLSNLQGDLPVMLEHLNNESEYDQATDFINSIINNNK